MLRSYGRSIPSWRLMSAARGKSEREKEVNFSHLARKRSHFSCCENGSKTWRVTPGSTRVSLFIAALRRNVLSLSLFHSLFGEAPKSAREGACAPQMEIGAFAEC